MKILKYILIALGVVVLLIGGAALFVHLRGAPTYEAKNPTVKIDYTAERVARGARLASMNCVHCHSNEVTGALTGNQLKELPPEFGVFHSRNITQHPTKGIGSWTDGELVYLLRTGIARDGSYIIPMGGFSRMSDEDLYSIVAWLRSDDPRLRPAAVDNNRSEYSFLAKALATFVFKPKEYPTNAISAPDPSDKVAFGRYLATGVTDCFACHSADFKTMDDEHPEQSERFFGGGNPLTDVNGKTIHSRNITPDRATGIGNWTEAQFIRAVRDGFRPDNTPLRFPMMRYNEFSDQEISAIYAYLRTVPAINYKVPESQDYRMVEASATGGKQIYYKYSCYACHGEDGKGNCDLRDAHKKYPTNDTLIAWIRDPSAIKPDTKMPTWQGVIKPEEFAPLAQYVRELGQQGTQVAAR